MNFNSDNVYGVHPAILDAMAAANGGTCSSYGADPFTAKAEVQLAEVFGRKVKSFLVATGTAANSLALSSFASGFGIVLCHEDAHIMTDECNAPEMFTGGARLLGLQGQGGKILPQAIEAALGRFVHGEHGGRPQGISITNATELGTVYTTAQVKEIGDCAKTHGLALHMDGARFANAVAHLGCTPAELTWEAGVGVLSFGATKNGAMMLEAVVFFDDALAENFLFRRKRAGQLVSKGRYLGAQMVAYLADGRWLQNARQANALAAQLAAGLSEISGVRIAHPVEANEVFAVMPCALIDALLKAGVQFHDWLPDRIIGKLGEDEVFNRFVLSFATPAEDVARFLALAENLAR